MILNKSYILIIMSIYIIIVEVNTLTEKNNDYDLVCSKSIHSLFDDCYNENNCTTPKQYADFIMLVVDNNVLTDSFKKGFVNHIFKAISIKTTFPFFSKKFYSPKKFCKTYTLYADQKCCYVELHDYKFKNRWTTKAVNYVYYNLCILPNKPFVTAYMKYVMNAVEFNDEKLNGINTPEQYCNKYAAIVYKQNLY